MCLLQSCLLFRLEANRKKGEIAAAASAAMVKEPEHSVNWTMGNAVSISLNKPFSGKQNRLFSAKDANWFSFPIDKPGFISVELALSSETMVHGFTALVCDGSGNTILDARDVMDFTRRAVAPGICFLRIMSADSYGFSAGYSITVKFTPFDFEGEWESEPNDSPGSANWLEFGKTVSGLLLSQGDADWFRFLAERPCVVRIEFDHEIADSPSAAWRLRLFDVSAEKELEVLDIKGDEEYCTSGGISLAEGTHYISIEGAALSAEELFYSLRVSNQGDL